MKPDTEDAYRLMHEGSLALAEVERAGMRADVAALGATIEDVAGQIARLAAELKRSEEWRAWKRRYGEEASLGSRVQLATVLFDVLGYESAGITKSKRYRTDEDALGQVDLPFVRTWLQAEKLKKLRTTNLEGVRREVVDGFIHPSFNLHLVRTYRSSADSPNVQQIPVRDEEAGALIRRCFVPRDDHVLVEMDYNALEWKIASCFWRDSAMLAEASDPTLDVHRDMAAECYLLPVDEVPKSVRSMAKSHFVFATLYGSYYRNTSRGLWNAVAQQELKDVDGRCLYEHLRRKHRISELGDCNGRPRKGTFERHVQQVERKFAGRFPQWAERKEQWLAKYQRQGWFRTMTGFVCSGVYKRNELFNYPVQGPAFHCLLWSLIRLVKRLKKRRMRSRVVAEIHDSIIGDVHRDELDEYVDMSRRIMTEEIREHWLWIITPLEVEVEVSETNWHEKRRVLG